jgi:hypothetical protein
MLGMAGVVATDMGGSTWNVPLGTAVGEVIGAAI